MNIRVALVAAAVAVCGAAASAQQPIGAELVDEETIAEWFSKGADENLLAALMWYSSQWQIDGGMEDLEVVAEWHIKGAREGLIAAMMWHSVLLLSSVEAPEDGEWSHVRAEDGHVFLEAYAWLHIAASCDELSAAFRDALADVLSADQIAAAHRQSQHLFDEHLQGAQCADTPYGPALMAPVHGTGDTAIADMDSLMQAPIADVEDLAEAGDVRAMVAAAIRYHEGIGVPRSIERFGGWARVAAEHGMLVGALFYGSYLMERGHNENDEGTFVEGYAWLNVAASCGDETAVDGRDQLAAVLDREQLVAAERRSAEIFRDYFGGSVRCVEDP